MSTDAPGPRRPIAAMKIAIVNDVRMAVEALRRSLAFSPEHEIIWTASNGADASRCARNTRPT